MSSRMTGEWSVVQCCDIVGVFTGMMIRRCETVPIVLPFDNSIRWDIVERVMAEETILEMAKCFGAYGGTSLSAPIEYLLRENIDVDHIIAFTDNEEWVGRPFIEAIEDYMRRVNPEVRINLVTLLPYRDYPTPIGWRNVRYIFGWSDYVLRYIAADEKQQVEEVKRVEI